VRHSKKDAKDLHDKFFRSFERVANSGPLAWMAMGMIVQRIRKSLEGDAHKEAPRDARILMIGVDIVEAELRGKADDGISECMSMAAMHYMIAGEPNLSTENKDIMERLMKTLT